MTYLYQKQIKHFEHYENVGLKVYVVDGFGHKDYYNSSKRHYLQSHLLKNFKLVKDRLRFNGREIIIEFDDVQWAGNYANAIKVIDFLQKNSIPYELIITGGRGLRFSIFTKINYAQSTIFALYCYSCYLIGIDWQTSGMPENKAVNHCVGCIGKIGKLGYYATYSKEVPEKRPQIKIFEVQFPEKVELWNVSKKFLVNALDYASKIPKKEVMKNYEKFKYKKPLLELKW